MSHVHRSLSRSSWILIFILFIALLLRLAAMLASMRVAVLYDYVAGKDVLGYLQLATNTLATGQYRFDVGGPSAFRMPGYSLFLAATYLPLGRPLLSQLIQVAADLCTIGLIWSIGRTLSPSLWVAALSALLYAIYPLTIVASIILYPEVLAVLCVTAMVALMVRPRVDLRHGAMLGLLAALGVYIKPSLALTVLTLLALFTLLSYQRRGLNMRSIPYAFVPFVVFAVLMAPWIIRNSMELGSPVLLTTSNGSNLYGGNNAQSGGGYVSDLPLVLPEYTEVDSDKVLAALAADWIRNHPPDFLRLLPQKALRFFHPLALGSAGNIDVPGPLYWLVALAAAALYGCAIAGGISLLRCRAYWIVAVLATPTLTLLVTTLISFGSARFLLPALPTIFLLASLAIKALTSRLPVRKISSTPAAIVSEL